MNSKKNILTPELQGTTNKCVIKHPSWSGQYNERVLQVIKDIAKEQNKIEIFSHVKQEAIIGIDSVIETVELIKKLLFPGYFTERTLDPLLLQNNTERYVLCLFNTLSEQIFRCIRYDRIRQKRAEADCRKEGYEIALSLLRSIPLIQKTLATDIIATYEGDPAAKSYDEIISCYPGIFAISVYRVANRLFELGVPLLPRMMTEYAHSATGIDIHPGADIDDRFVIDHGTGIVIGETTKIGKNVRIYQGVTIGALSIPKNKADSMRWKKRHPTIGDDVVIYSGATILGGNTIIGSRAVIGGNVWITESVPEGTKVILKQPELLFE